MPSRVLIVDDHALLRVAIRSMLTSDSDLEVVGEAGDGEEALALCRKLPAPSADPSEGSRPSTRSSSCGWLEPWPGKRDPQSKRPKPHHPSPLKSSRSCAAPRWGKTNRQISEDLHLSLSTVKRHLERIISKLGVSDRTQAAVKAVELGLTEPERTK